MNKFKLNMRKVVAIAICLAGSATMFAQDNTTDEGVIINGVKWATRNVDVPGTFAVNPEDAGMFYQWNRKTAQAATGAVTGWENSTPTGTVWEKANDPSPAGWRIPTKAEIEKLSDANKVSHEWTTQNGVKGRKFTDKATGSSLFLIAATATVRSAAQEITANIVSSAKCPAWDNILLTVGEHSVTYGHEYSNSAGLKVSMLLFLPVD